MKINLLISCLFFATTCYSFGQRIVDNTPSNNVQTSIGYLKLPNGNSWEDKHFREALLGEREYRGFYVLINEDKKIVKAETLVEYCKAHDYRWREKYETKNVSRFGDFATSVSKFYFIPNALYYQYVFEWTDRTMSNGKNLKNKGTVYFFDPDSYSFICIKDNALWTGQVVDGYIEGSGAGIWQKDDKHYYYFSGNFSKGFPVGKAKYRIVFADPSNSWGYSPREEMPSKKRGDGAPFREVEVGEMHDGMALFRYLDSGDASNKSDTKGYYGYVRDDGVIAIKPAYTTAFSFNGDRAVVKNEKGEDIYIGKTGQFIDYTEGQKQIYAEEKARQDAIKAEEERQRLLAEQKAEEERRAAEAKEADLQRRIEINKDPKLWSRGCKLAYRYPNGTEYVIATLEEWGDTRTRAKVKVIASPNSTRTLNGELLSKNNTMWISVYNEGWHLALDDEISEALRQDRSADDHICHSCNGRGTIPCYNCNGTGVEDSYRHYTCTVCKGKGSRRCSSCGGSGRN